MLPTPAHSPLHRRVAAAFSPVRTFACGPLLAIAIIGCSDSGPEPASLPGTWALQTVNGQSLPHSFTDTVQVPDGDPVIFTTVVVADTLRLRTGTSLRHTWLDDGSVTTDLVWSSTGPGDSVTVTEVFPTGISPHYGVLDGDRLTVRIATLVRPGVYDYARVL